MSNNHFTTFYDEMQERFVCEIESYQPLGVVTPMLRVNLTPKRIQQVCPECGSTATHIHEHNEREIHGGSYLGVPVIFVMDSIRYLCSHCGKTFVEKFECLPAGYSITKEAEIYILWHLGQMPMLRIAEALGVSEQTIANRAAAYGQRELEIMLQGHYQYLSMDEVFIGHTHDNQHVIYWVLNDISVSWKANNIMLGKGRLKDDVRTRLEQLAHPDEVAAVSIDMWEPYREAIEAALPNAAPVVDKFHVIKNAEERMNQVRKQTNCSKEDKAAMNF